MAIEIQTRGWGCGGIWGQTTLWMDSWFFMARFKVQLLLSHYRAFDLYAGGPALFASLHYCVNLMYEHKCVDFITSILKCTECFQGDRRPPCPPIPHAVSSTHWSEVVPLVWECSLCLFKIPLLLLTLLLLSQLRALHVRRMTIVRRPEI